MGSTAQCWLDNLYIGETKDDIDTELISLFRPKDKVVKSSSIKDLPIQFEHYRESIIEDPEFKLVYYEAPVNIICDRLNLLGYDLITAKKSFQLWIDEERNHSLRLAENCHKKDSGYVEGMAGYYEQTAKVLSSLSPEVWMEKILEIRASGLRSYNFRKLESGNTTEYMLSHDWYGFPGFDLFVPLRLAIEACDISDKLVYDLSELVYSEYFDSNDDFVEYGIGVFSSEYRSKSKTIVLTEGKSDARILNESMDFLYPHLKDYFSFLDFETTGLGGGVGNLVNVVKAFAGAGIVNNVIALFDNDTAAISACRSLNNVTMPPNIVIKYLPELALLRNYPTIGPSGFVNLDVNGIAASLELYLGTDVLLLDGTSFVPIQWTGYDSALKKYQGEVLKKAEIQDRFKNKLIRARNGETDAFDWSGLRSVFDVIFTSFLGVNRDAICKRPSDYYANY